MAIAKRGSRRIVVDGQVYRWRLQKRPTPDQRSGRTPLLLAVASEEGDGAKLVLRLHRHHPRNAVGLRSHAVTPGQVAQYIRQGLAAGWQPQEPGRPFVWEPRSLPAKHAPTRIYPPGLAPQTPEQLLGLARRTRTFDTLELIAGPVVHWPEGGSYDPSGLQINGRDLIDWVHAVELPHVERELAMRREAGDEDCGASYAGDYLGLPARRYRLPSRHLLGEGTCGPVDHFVVPPDDPRRKKTMLLSCTCGITECWFLLASIDVFDDFVVWSDFEQFHRDWVYDLGPFVFKKSAYVAALSP